jgi:hypothetical protein
MSTTPKVTKKQLIKMIDELKKNPNDKVRILGDVGITIIGLGLGAAAAGTVAGVAGATSILGLTTVAGWLGVTAVAATPIGWTIGSAAAAGVLVYGVSRIIHGGGLSEGRKAQLLQQCQEKANNIEAKERSESITDADRTQFILFMREPIDKNIIYPESAYKLIKFVEQGRIPISQAFSLIYDLLEENSTS